ncbi:hypothetical protein, partial [Caballeronia sp. GACF5]|uniref:hypothetical protein n=1 Tax=Caballeronia sp. GACF5 TaxID=2921746 RepID=UPI0020287359
GTAVQGIANQSTIAATATASADIFLSNVGTAASAFTLTDLRHFRVSQGTFGSGSAVTTQTGYEVNTNLTGATTNYGFRGRIPSGTGRWNLYMDG